MSNIAMLGKGTSLKLYSKYSHLFKKVYLINRFQKEINKIGVSHFKNKEVIQVVGRASVQLSDGQYKDLKIKDVYLTVFDMFHFKTGKGKVLKKSFPKFVSLIVAPKYMYDRAFYFDDSEWKDVWGYVEVVNKYRGIEAIKELNKIIGDKFSELIKYRKKNPNEYLKGVKGWFSTGSYAVDLALTQSEDGDNFYLFGFDFYNTKYLVPSKLDKNYTRESYGTLLQKWHMKKLVEEFGSINFYSPCDIEICKSPDKKVCDGEVIKRCDELGLLKMDYKNWHIIKK